MVRPAGAANPASATPVYLIRKTFTCNATGLIVIDYDWPDVPFCNVTPWVLSVNSRPPNYGILSKSKTRTVVKLWKVVTATPVLSQALDCLADVSAAGEKADVQLSL